MNNTGKKTEVAGSSSTEKPNTTFKNPTTNEDLKALIEILTATLTGKVNQLQVDFQASTRENDHIKDRLVNLENSTKVILNRMSNLEANAAGKDYQLVDIFSQVLVKLLKG